MSGTKASRGQAGKGRDKKHLCGAFTCTLYWLKPLIHMLLSFMTYFLDGGYCTV